MEEEPKNIEEEEMEVEYEAPTRHENMAVISWVYEMYKQEDTMTANATKRKNSVINKCLKLAKRFVDEIYDETFFIESKEEEK